MPDFNMHALDGSWAEPEVERVQEFFDNLSEMYVRDEPLLIKDTTKQELDYIAAKATEAALAQEAGSIGAMEDEADTATEEKELAQWAESAGGQRRRRRGPLFEEVGDESSDKEAEADNPLAVGRKRVLRRASSGEPVQPDRTTQRQPAQEQPVHETRAMKAVAAKKTVKATVTKKTATASSSSKRRQTLSPSPPPSDSTLEAEFDLGSFSPKRKRKPVEEEVEDKDMETMAQRVAKRARASTSDKPPAGVPHTPVVVEISPDNSPRHSPSLSPQHPPSMDQDGIDIVIEEVARDAEAEPTKVATEEAAKSAAEEAAKGPTGEASETAAGEAGKGPARKSGKATTEEAAKEPAEEEVANDQSSSPAAPALDKYLKVGDHLFVRLPGTAGGRAPAEGEVFDDETLATAGLQVVDEPSVGGDGSQEEKLLRAMSVNFQKLQALHRARLDKAKCKMTAVDKAQAWFRDAQEELKASQGELAERKCELILKQADIEKAQELAKEQELEQRHKEALNALALVHVDKVKKLEPEREELKKVVLELTKEKDTANGALADAQTALKLDGLEGTLSQTRAREETLNQALEDERQKRKNDAANHEDYVASVELWISRLIDVAGKPTAQLAVMGMPDVRLSEDRNISPNARLNLFFKRDLDAFDQLRSNRATYLANEARKLYRGALTKVLTKVALWNPTVNFADALESLPEEADLAALKERIKPIIDCVERVQRLFVATQTVVAVVDDTRGQLIDVAFSSRAIAMKKSMR
nr:MICAL-like protein 1 [Aegilops tauschii subsp. strangulata]